MLILIMGESWPINALKDILVQLAHIWKQTY